MFGSAFREFRRKVSREIEVLRSEMGSATETRRLLIEKTNELDERLGVISGTLTEAWDEMRERLEKHRQDTDVEIARMQLAVSKDERRHVGGS